MEVISFRCWIGMPMQMKQMEVKSAALKNINISIKDVVEIK